MQSGGLAGQSLEDSLVLDETIIDELIDDISMTASVVTEGPTPPGPEEDYEAEVDSDIVTSVEPAPVISSGRTSISSVAATAAFSKDFLLHEPKSRSLW